MDSAAVAVLVEGERIGYLPSYVARSCRLAPGDTRLVPVQVFAEVVPKGLRVEAWVWLGSGAPQWEWSQVDRPPLSPRAKAAAAHAETRKMVQEARRGGGQRAKEFEAGTVEGWHYLELVEPIKQLKRQGQLEEALVLCYKAIEGAERDFQDSSPAPWYTTQAAIVLRKLGRREEEVEVLQRWLARCPVEHRADSEAGKRLAKLTGRAGS